MSNCRSIFFVRLVIVGVAMTSAGQAQADSFTGIGFFAGVDTSYANGVSADGSTVVGASGRYVARWTETGGIEHLGSVAAGAAYAASADGSVIVGSTSPGAFRWDATNGYQNLNDPSMTSGSNALAVSDDGRFVGGERYNPEQGVIWDGASDGMLPGPSTIRGMSSDGGYRLGVTTRGYGGFGYSDTYRISADGSLLNIGYLTGAANTYGTAMSADGSAIVGIDNRGNLFAHYDPVAFLWTESDGIRSLGRLAGTLSATAKALTTSGLLGTMVVGQSGSQSFLWAESLGMVDLKSYLTGRGLDLAGWTLTGATGISSDGLTIVGQGINANGLQEGWVARLSGPTAVPEPASIAMLALGGLVVGVAARRSRWTA